MCDRSDEDDEASLAKWMCQVCTFKNWPKSIKCTMCLHEKSSPIIAYKSDDQNIPTLICAEAQSPKLTLDQDRSNPFKKWACSGCTYLNWPKAAKCTQCNIARPQSNERDSKMVRKLTPTRTVNESAASIMKLAKSDRWRRDSPNMNPPCSIGGENACCSVDRDSTSAKDRSSSKWMCYACTYENWPKSNKCVICLTPRQQLVKSGDGISTSTQSSPESPTIMNPQRAYHLNNRRNDSKCSSPVEEGDGRSPKALHSQSVIPSSSSNNYAEERRLKQLQRRRKLISKDIRDANWVWLNACVGVVDGDRQAVELYLHSGGSPERQLTATEVSILGRPSAFECGYTLVHLAVRFRREDMLAVLLSNGDSPTNTISTNDDVVTNIKRVPSDFCLDVAIKVRRNVACSIRQRRSNDFPCFYISSDVVTFALPSAIDELPIIVHDKLFNELLDRHVQKELEEESPIINWSLELTERLGSRLYALWNRTAGDCLLDSVLQASWGVFDVENTVRRAMADSLSECAAVFYPRWKESEAIHAHLLQFSLDENQWQQDWAILLSIALQPGSSLEQLHIFALCHVLRRPIIVYGVKYVKGFRGEAIGLARFEGVYLPLLWEASFCWKTPVALGYTRGHFSALVPMQPDNVDEENVGATGASTRTNNDDLQLIFLPLMTSDLKLLPIHFLTSSELGQEEELLRKWLDCCVTEGGILVAQQRIQKRPPLVEEMLNEWLHHYRTLAEMISPTEPSNNEEDGRQYSSDDASDKD